MNLEWLIAFILIDEFIQGYLILYRCLWPAQLRRSSLRITQPSHVTTVPSGTPSEEEDRYEEASVLFMLWPIKGSDLASRQEENGEVHSQSCCKQSGWPYLVTNNSKFSPTHAAGFLSPTKPKRWADRRRGEHCDRLCTYQVRQTATAYLSGMNQIAVAMVAAIECAFILLIWQLLYPLLYLLPAPPLPSSLPSSLPSLLSPSFLILFLPLIFLVSTLRTLEPLLIILAQLPTLSMPGQTFSWMCLGEPCANIITCPQHLFTTEVNHRPIPMPHSHYRFYSSTLTLHNLNINYSCTHTMSQLRISGTSVLYLYCSSGSDC